MAITTAQLLSFNQLVSNAVAAAQAKSPQLLNLTDGSAFLAAIQAHAGNELWLQYLIISVLALTRASSSTATDLDTWMADWAFARLQAVPATGRVTFSRTSASQQAVIPLGSQIKTVDGTQAFFVTGTSNWIFLAGVTSLTVTVQAVTPGTGGNIAANTLSLLAGAIPYVDSVTNAEPFTNGVDSESDDAFRTRFVAFIGSLPRGTADAIGYAVEAAQQGLSYSIIENTPNLGDFTVVVDDGTGNPTPSLLSLVLLHIQQYAPIDTQPYVVGPFVVSVAVEMTITVANGVAKSLLVAPIQSAVTAYVNGLGIGATLSYTKLASVVYSASPFITNVSGLIANGNPNDIYPGPTGVVRAALVTVS